MCIHNSQSLVGLVVEVADMRRLTYVPIPLAVSSRRKVDTDGYLWQTVPSVTGWKRDLGAGISVRG